MKRLVLICSATLFFFAFGPAEAANHAQNARLKRVVAKSLRTLNKATARLKQVQSAEAQQMRESLAIMKKSLSATYLDAFRNGTFSAEGNRAILNTYLWVTSDRSMLSGKRTLSISGAGVTQKLTVSSSLSRTRAVRLEDNSVGTFEVVTGQR